MTDNLYLPQNKEEAKEVLQVLTREIIISNVNGNKINATKASQEITDMIINNLKGTK